MGERNGVATVASTASTASGCVDGLEAFTAHVLGPFTMYQPSEGGAGWRVVYEGTFLPGRFADRFAALMACGCVLGRSVLGEQLHAALDDVQDQVYGRLITVEDLAGFSATRDETATGGTDGTGDPGGAGDDLVSPQGEIAELLTCIQALVLRNRQRGGVSRDEMAVNAELYCSYFAAVWYLKALVEAAPQRAARACRELVGILESGDGVGVMTWHMLEDIDVDPGRVDAGSPVQDMFAVDTTARGR